MPATGSEEALGSGRLLGVCHPRAPGTPTSGLVTRGSLASSPDTASAGHRGDSLGDTDLLQSDQDDA